MSTVLIVLEIIGVISFSVTGALMAIDKENDFLGVVFLAVITSFGGGMMRDLFIGNTPPLFFSSYYLVAVCVGTATVVFVLAAIFKKQYVKHEGIINVINNYVDAIGLGVFVISGVKICISCGIDNPFLIVIMGMLSGTGGSMTRDVIMREIPALFKKRIYLIAGIVGACAYYLMFKLEVWDVVSVSVSAGLVVLIRILATIFKWNMPRAIDFDKLRSDK